MIDFVDFDILVVSTDRMFDVAFQVYKKNLEYFGDGHNAILVTENKLVVNYKIEEKPETLSFYERVAFASSYCNKKYVLLLLDDFVITKINDKASVKSVIDDLEPDYIRLRACPPNGTPIVGYKPFLITDRKNGYQINTQPSLWKLDALLRIIDNEVTPWTLELQYALLKSKKLGVTLNVARDVISASEIVKKGKVRPIYAWLYKLDTSNVKVMSIFSDLKTSYHDYIVNFAFKFGLLK